MLHTFRQLFVNGYFSYCWLSLTSINWHNATNDVKKRDKNNETYTCEQKNCLNAYANIGIDNFLAFFV